MHDFWIIINIALSYMGNGTIDNTTTTRLLRGGGVGVLAVYLNLLRREDRLPSLG